MRVSNHRAGLCLFLLLAANASIARADEPASPASAQSPALPDGVPPPLAPAEALKSLTLAKDLKIELIASEPAVEQPVSISFDDRGRLWVLQYLQYPNPAGLKPVQQDQYLRTVWDRVPEPPPKGPRGLDRITICSEPDAEGRFTRSKDFVTGLNLATGFCIGHGGDFVLQSPYLLF